MPHILKDMRAVTVDIKSTMDLLIPAGLIRGTSHINKFGRNPDVDTADAPEDIWDIGGLWVPPTVPRLHNIVSSVANDAGTLVSSGTVTRGSTTSIEDENATFQTDGVAVNDVVLNDTNIDHSVVASVDSETKLTLESSHHAAYTEQRAATVGFNNKDSYRIVTPASTGASVVHVFGLDENFDELEEFVITNGTNNVATASTYWRIYRMHIDGAASRVTNNVGNITATAQTDNTVQGQISIGIGQTLQAIYTIPNGKTGYMTQFSSTIFKGAVGALANMTLRQTKFAGPDGSGSVTEHYFSLATDGSSHVVHRFEPNKPFEEKTDVWMRCEASSTNDVQITGAFDIILVDNI
jgi:hypothetical protein